MFIEESFILIYPFIYFYLNMMMLCGLADGTTLSYLSLSLSLSLSITYPPTHPSIGLMVNPIQTGGGGVWLSTKST